MENFVISLDSAIDRRTHIKNEFGAKKINFSFFDAINPNTLNTVCNKYNLDLSHSQLSENEKSCFMSHYVLWNKAIEENIEYIAIFEDDIYLGASAEIFLNSEEWINVDIIKVEKTKETVLLSSKNRKKSYNGQNYSLSKLKSSHMGAGGYILSLRAAKDLVDYINISEQIDHVDQIIFKWYREANNLNIYQINPVLCVQDCILYPENQKFQSSLQWRERDKVKLSVYAKIKRELNRLLLKIIEIPYRVKLIFIK